MKPVISVPALDKVVKILDLLTQKNEPISSTDIVKSLNLPKSSVHGLLIGLQQANLIRKVNDRYFVLGPHIMYWANGFLEQQNVVSEFNAAIESIPELSAYTLTLSTLNHDQVVYLACKNSDMPLGVTFQIGMQAPAVFTATGKAMLSSLDDEEIVAQIDVLPTPYTDRSVTSIEQLLQEMKRIRQQGYAVDDGQLRLGMYCFGVPVYDYTGVARFGIAASLIEPEVNEERCVHLVQGLKSLAQRLSKIIGG